MHLTIDDFQINDYLTKIPHAFGTKRATFLETIDDLKAELELLEALSNAELASELLEGAEPGVKKVNPSDKNYERLKCEMTPMDVKDPHYKVKFLKEIIFKS